VGPSSGGGIGMFVGRKKRNLELKGLIKAIRGGGGGAKERGALNQVKPFAERGLFQEVCEGISDGTTEGGILARGGKRQRKGSSLGRYLLYAVVGGQVQA